MITLRKILFICSNEEFSVEGSSYILYYFAANIGSQKGERGINLFLITRGDSVGRDRVGDEGGFEMKFGRLFCISRERRSGVERVGRS